MLQHEQISPDQGGSQDLEFKLAKLSMDFWQTRMQDMLAAASGSSQQVQHQPGSLSRGSACRAQKTRSQECVKQKPDFKPLDLPKDHGGL